MQCPVWYSRHRYAHKYVQPFRVQVNTDQSMKHWDVSFVSAITIDIAYIISRASCLPVHLMSSVYLHTAMVYDVEGVRLVRNMYISYL